MWLMSSIASWVVLGIIGGRMFAHRGYHPFIGVIAGILLGPFGLAYCWFLPMTRTARSEWAAEKAIAAAGASSKVCPTCGRQCGGLATFCPRCDHVFPTPG